MRVRGGFQVSAETRDHGAELVGAVVRFRGQSFRTSAGVALALLDAEPDADLRDIIAEAEQAALADEPEREPRMIVEGSLDIRDSWRDRKRDARAERFIDSIPESEWDRVWTPDFEGYAVAEKRTRYLETPGQARAALARAERNGQAKLAENLRRSIKKLGW